MDYTRIGNPILFCARSVELPRPRRSPLMLVLVRPRCPLVEAVRDARQAGYRPLRSSHDGAVDNNIELLAWPVVPTGAVAVRRGRRVVLDLAVDQIDDPVNGNA